MTDMAHVSFLADTLPCAVRILKTTYRTDSVFYIFFLELVDHGDRRSSGSLAMISDSLKTLFKKVNFPNQQAVFSADQNIANWVWDV